MPSKLKKMVRARTEKTGQSWQTALRYVRAQAAPAMSVPPRVAELLRSLHAPTAFSMLVGRVPSTAAGANFELVQKQADDLARYPRYYAATGSATSTITLDDHNLLIAHGAADDRSVQIIRSCKLEGELVKVFTHTTFSERCHNCDGLIWCGEDEHEADCVCGQHYRVSFDGMIDGRVPVRVEI